VQNPTTTSLVFLTHPLYIERWSKTHHFAGTQKLHEMIQQPYDLFKPGWADQYVVGMINQVAQAMDDFITSQVSHTLTFTGRQPPPLYSVLYGII
jgi:hypothetical protein